MFLYAKNSHNYREYRVDRALLFEWSSDRPWIARDPWPSSRLGASDTSNIDWVGWVCMCARVCACACACARLRECVRACVLDVFAVYDNNILPRLIMIIIKITILYLIQIPHTDDFPSTGTRPVFSNIHRMVYSNMILYTIYTVVVRGKVAASAMHDDAVYQPTTTTCRCFCPRNISHRSNLELNGTNLCRTYGKMGNGFRLRNSGYSHMIYLNTKGRMRIISASCLSRPPRQTASRS